MNQFDIDVYVKIVGENIVSQIWYEGNGGKLYYLEDKGNVLEVKQLLSDSVWSDWYISPVPGEDAFLCWLSHVPEAVIMFPKTNTMKLIPTDKLLDDIYTNELNPFIPLMTYNNRIFTYTSCGNINDDLPYYVSWLHLDSLGEDVYLYNNYCSVTIEKEETIYLRQLYDNGIIYDDEIYFNLKVNENDPMCFVVSPSSSKKAENGITLPPGKYEFFLSGVDYDHGGTRVLYVDKSGERTHRVGPHHFIHFLTVDTATQTASWDDLYMSYWGVGAIDEQFVDGSSPVVSVSNGVACSALLDLEKKEYSFKTFKIPDGFPSEGWEYTGWNAYKIVGDSEICVYSLETMQAETFPIIMTELPSDIVGNIDWVFNGKLMMFYGRAMTLEGNDITIYIPVTGDKRGVARISIDEASGAGDIVSQIIRLN